MPDLVEESTPALIARPILPADERAERMSRYEAEVAFHNDREVRGGGTPAERYAGRHDLPADERAAASRIASAALGVHRVIAVEPGSLLLLEDLIGGGRVQVRSGNVSREAVRWDILIGRIMDGEPLTLWGPTRLLEPCEEPDFAAELERFSSVRIPREGRGSAALRGDQALALMRFRSPSWDAERGFFTLEGDPVVQASAIRSVRDVRKAQERFRLLGQLGTRNPLEIDITMSRAYLVAGHPELPQPFRRTSTASLVWPRRLASASSPPDPSRWKRAPRSASAGACGQPVISVCCLDGGGVSGATRTRPS